jgi:hypothetical protein
MTRVAALTLLLTLGLTGCGSGSSSGAPTPGPPLVVAGTFRCPDPEAAATTVVDHGADTLPTGALGAVLCVHDDHVPWSAPRGQLQTGLDDLVGVVNAQRVFHPSPDLACGGVGAPAWTMVLSYPGGTRTISGDNGGCWDLLVGRTQRYGSRHVYDAYLTALVAQRTSQGTPDSRRTPPGCPATSYPATSPAGDPRLLVSASWCRHAGNHWKPWPGC